ncbi:MAG: [LysW]-lysine hydrolase [Trueperaceae bacterium]|nr:[LysW]-lysine hydrolase [Trueperaceae bacterium]
MTDDIAFLKQAISIPSVSGKETELASFLVSEMQSFCDEAFVDDSGSAIGVWGHGPLKITFLGHIDTVPGDIPVRIENDVLWGRGSVDAKGPFCTAVAASSYLDPQLKEKLSLRLIGATEEEAPSSKGARYAVQTYPKPDLVIIGEPSNWDALTLGYKGRLVSKWQLAKANFHSAGDDTTAAEDLVSIWQTLKAQADTFNSEIRGIFDALQISLQSISSSSDGLEQRAEATIGYRLPPSLSPDELIEKIEALRLQAKAEFVGKEIAYRSDKDTALTRAFRLSIRQHEGKPRFKVKTGTSDMNVVAPVWNVPMLAYGPGDSSLDHTPEERLELGEYKKAIAVLTTALELLAKA